MTGRRRSRIPKVDIRDIAVPRPEDPHPPDPDPVPVSFFCTGRLTHPAVHAVNAEAKAGRRPAFNAKYGLGWHRDYGSSGHGWIEFRCPACGRTLRLGERLLARLMYAQTALAQLPPGEVPGEVPVDISFM